MINFNNDWNEILKDEFKKDYYIKLRSILKEEYRNYEIYPEINDIFNALKYTSFNDTKIIIIGQDPYIQPGQAHGLSFSVKPGINIPPSLKNIFKELEDDCGCYIPNNGCLTPWANQGILLLNNILTVRKGKSNSHSTIGWEDFSDNIINILNNNKDNLIFMLWGRNAQKKVSLITPKKHLVLLASHPSPLAGNRFFGCKHFSKANEFLTLIGSSTINWQVNNI